jgi:hypothetical protein
MNTFKQLSPNTRAAIFIAVGFGIRLCIAHGNLDLFMNPRFPLFIN